MQEEVDNSVRLTAFVDEDGLVVAAMREPIRADEQCHVTQPVKVHVVVPNSRNLCNLVQRVR